MMGGIMFIPPLLLQGRGTARSAVEGLRAQPAVFDGGPSTMLGMVPLPSNARGGIR
jgi:hypothetical protein